MRGDEILTPIVSKLQKTDELKEQNGCEAFEIQFAKVPKMLDSKDFQEKPVGDQHALVHVS